MIKMRTSREGPGRSRVFLYRRERQRELRTISHICKAGAHWGAEGREGARGDVGYRRSNDLGSTVRGTSC